MVCAWYVYSLCVVSGRSEGLINLRVSRLVVFVVDCARSREGLDADCRRHINRPTEHRGALSDTEGGGGNRGRQYKCLSIRLFNRITHMNVISK